MNRYHSESLLFPWQLMNLNLSHMNNARVTQGTEHVFHLAIWSASTWGRAICSKETGGAPGDPKFLFGWSSDVNGENVMLYSLANAAFAAAAFPSFLLGPATKHACNLSHISRTQTLSSQFWWCICEGILLMILIVHSYQNSLQISSTLFLWKQTRRQRKYGFVPNHLELLNCTANFKHKGQWFWCFSLFKFWD